MNQQKKKQPLMSAAFEHFPAMNRLLRNHLVGRTVTDLLVDKDCTVIALDNGSVLEIPGFRFEFRNSRLLPIETNSRLTLSRKSASSSNG